MKIFNGCVRKISASMSLAMVYGLFSLSSDAAVFEIKASFAPDSSAPHKNEFVNQTPSQGFCAQVPQACESEGIFSLIAPISFAANAPIRANHADPRQGGMAKVPSFWRDVQVKNEAGETENLKIRIAGIGHESLLPVPVKDITGASGVDGWNRLWREGGWVYAPLPCQGVGWYTWGQQGYNSFWKVPLGAGVCSKQALFDIPQTFKYQYFVFGYQLVAPNPLNMKSGSYTGSITFSVGPGRDFDMGDVMQPDDSALTLNFNLEVQHTLKVDIPPGGEKIQLVPAGGWQSWLQAGRRPVRLFRDQTFNISASSRFKVFLDCRFDTIFVGCVVRAPDGSHIIEVHVSISLPNGLTNLDGQPVRRQRLGLEGDAQQLFQPGFYVDRAPGTLHFEIVQADVARMLRTGVTNFSGVVTVIWDSEV
jgi:hypothetical protein